MQAGDMRLSVLSLKLKLGVYRVVCNMTVIKLTKNKPKQIAAMEKPTKQNVLQGEP